MYYSINGKLLKKGKKPENQFDTEISSNDLGEKWGPAPNLLIENFAENKKTDEEGLALLGNLNLDGNVSAKGFYLSDGTKVPEIVKFPEGVTSDDKKIGINVKKPKSQLHVGGEFNIENPKSSTKFNIKNKGSNVITGNTTFKDGSSVFDLAEVKIKNPKNDNNPDGESTYFNYQGSGKNIISGKTSFSQSVDAKDINVNTLNAENIESSNFKTKKEIQSKSMKADSLTGKNINAENVNIKGNGKMLSLTGNDKSTLSFNVGESEIGELGISDSTKPDINLKNKTANGNLRLSVGSSGTKNNNIVISSEGNVGIKNEAPKNTLDVKGTVSATKYLNEKGEEIGKPNYDQRLDLNNGLNVKGGRTYFTDKENKGKVRVGAAYGIPGIYSEDQQDLLLGVHSSKNVLIGANGKYASVSGSGDMTVSGNILLNNSSSSGKIEGGSPDNSIYLGKGHKNESDILDLHSKGSINMFTGGEISKQGKRVEIDNEGNTTIFGKVKAKEYLDLNGQKISSGSSGGDSSVINYNAGGNDSESSITKKDEKIDMIMDLESYEIISSFTVLRADRRWRNIYQYGNNNGERAPSLWMYPKFSGDNWKMQFRLRTSRNTHDGINFDIPANFRSLNIPLNVKIVIEKEIPKKRFLLTISVNSQQVSKSYIPSTILYLRNRNLHIKCPWGGKSGYNVQSVIFRQKTPPTDEEVMLGTKIEKVQENVDKKFNEINLSLNRINNTVGSVNLGENKSANPKLVKNEMIDKILALNEYSIVTTVTFNEGGRHYKNIFHYGNNSRERAPALTILSNFQRDWRLLFRTRTNRNHYESFLFRIPDQFRVWKKPHEIIVNVKKEYEQNRIVLTAIVNGVEAESKIITGAKLDVLTNRNFYIKSPFLGRNRDGYTVESIEFKTPEKPSLIERQIKNKLDDSIDKINNSITIINRTLGTFSAGSNLTSNAVKINNDMLYEIMENESFEIKSNVTWSNASRAMRNIFHYGNENRERAPAMWLYPHFERNWRIHFRIRTNRNTNDGLDFTIPQQSRKWNEPHDIKITIKKMNEENKIELHAHVDGILAGSRTITGARLDNLKGRTLWVKDPWHNRDGYKVNSLVFSASKPPTEKEKELENRLNDTESKLSNVESTVSKIKGEVFVGENKEEKPFTKQSRDIDEALSDNDYTILTKIKIIRNDRNWRHVFQYGRNNGERMPVLLIFPNNPWRMHFRIRTNRGNEGFDFYIPAQFRKYNTDLEIKINVSGKKRLHQGHISGHKDVGSGNVNLEAHVNGISVGKREITGGAYINLYLGRPFHIKAPWFRRGLSGFTVESLAITGGKFTFNQDITFNSQVEIKNNIQLPEDARICFGTNCFDLTLLKQIKKSSYDIITKGLVNRYSTESFSNGIWKDSVGNADAKILGGKLEIVTKSSYAVGDDGLTKGFEYLKGNVPTKVEFPINLNNENWTVIYVTRYDPRGRAKGRILQGRTNFL